MPRTLMAAHLFLITLVACGGDDADTCTSSSDCAGAAVCYDGFCAREEPGPVADPNAEPPPPAAPSPVHVPPPFAGDGILMVTAETASDPNRSWQRLLPATPRLPNETYTGCIAGDGCTLDEAKHYCDQLTLYGGRDPTGFRLPTREYLASILSDVSKSRTSGLREPIFPETPHAWFWSASTSEPEGDAGDGAQQAYAVSFDELSPSSFGRVELRQPEEALRVRCVAGQ